MTKTQATAIVSGFLSKYTKEEMSVKLDITRVTLNTRLKQHNWKKGEISLIEKLK